MNNIRLNSAMANTERPHRDVSDKYKFIPTIEYLQPFFDRGWKISKQTGGNTAYAAHTVRLRHPDFTIPISGDHVEILVLNSHDRSCKFTVAGGLFRLVCANGLIVGENFEKFTFKHQGEDIDERIENSYDRIVAKLDEMKENFIKLTQTEFTEEQAKRIITNIHKRIFEKQTKTKKVDLISIGNLSRLLRVRRDEDKGHDAFTLMNIIQENITRKVGTRVTLMTTTYDKERKPERMLMSEVYNNPVELLTNVKNTFKVNSIITSEFLKEVA